MHKNIKNGRMKVISDEGWLVCPYCGGTDTHFISVEPNKVFRLKDNVGPSQKFETLSDAIVAEDSYNFRYNQDMRMNFCCEHCDVTNYDDKEKIWKHPIFQVVFYFHGGKNSIQTHHHPNFKSKVECEIELLEESNKIIASINFD